MAENKNKDLKKLVDDVVNECETCKTFAPTPPVHKAGMPKASHFNEVVSMDLKEWKERNVYILYCLDEFSRYIKAKIVNDKNPETIINAFNDCWLDEGPGVPTRALFFDNGGEFRNTLMREFASR